MPNLSVVKVKPLAGHILEISLNDSHTSIVDFAPFIFGVCHPDYEQYRSVESFLTFEIEDGNLNWGDYTMIFPVENLYSNRFDPWFEA